MIKSLGELQGQLNGLHTKDDVTELFTARLNYEYRGEQLPSIWEGDVAGLVEDFELLAEAANFQILFLDVIRNNRTSQRRILTQLLRKHPFGLYVLRGPPRTGAEPEIHFLNVKGDPEAEKPAKRKMLRRYVLRPGEVKRTLTERMGMLDVEKIKQANQGKISAPAIAMVHEMAFDVDQVTREFYDHYKEYFDLLKNRLTVQGIEAKKAHEFAQQLLNRLVFLYFVQRKGWMKGPENPKEFMSQLWWEYSQLSQQPEGPVDSYYRDWLRPLFLHGLNDGFETAKSRLPPRIRKWYEGLPYLNGGLFRPNELDALEVQIPDKFFEGLYLNLLDRYNFTVDENEPFDVEVAVDPEMLGHVYESLVLEDERAKGGIFYTQKVEIDLMCQLPLIEYLISSCGWENDMAKREAVTALVVGDDDEEEGRQTELFSKNDWHQMALKLGEITVCDPACGSGAFLMGMLQNIVKMVNKCYVGLGQAPPNPFNVKKKVIERSIYGGELKPWAAHIAELRLWLSLIVDAEESDLPPRGEPLLPNFTYKIGIGDSVVQRLGGRPWNLRRLKEGITDKDDTVRNNLKIVSNLKQRYYQAGKFDEIQLKKDIAKYTRKAILSVVSSEGNQLQTELYILTRAKQQLTFDGNVQTSIPISDKQRKRIEEINESLSQLAKVEKRLREAFDSDNDIDYPFIWDFTFPEVMLNPQKRGFDIVIANPPYVRQEAIAPPDKEDPNRAEKKQYKEYLFEEATNDWPTRPPKQDRKSDLYCYFYYKALNLVRPGGHFCFISSNSWLDVGYGAKLQAFLLQNIKVNQIIDNHAKRSFRGADVNTVISLFTRPASRPAAAAKAAAGSGSEADGQSLADHTARFVAYKVPFEEGFTAANALLSITAPEKTATDQLRVVPIDQGPLYIDGTEYGTAVPPIKGLKRKPSASPTAEPTPAPEVAAKTAAEATPTSSVASPTKSSAARKAQATLEGSPFAAKYTGNKWGGKFLRAPDIFYTILEKAGDKFVKIEKFADVKFGIKTGANEWFYLDEKQIKQLGIEKQFLQPIIRSPKNCTSILLDSNKLKSRIIVCHDDKKSLIGTKLFEYIHWGEKLHTELKKGKEKKYGQYHLRPSCKSRKRWWDIEKIESADFIWFKAFNDRFIVPMNIDYAPNSDRLYSINLKGEYEQLKEEVGMSLNSSITHLMCEIHGRVNLGEGALDNMTYEVEKLIVVDPKIIKSHRVWGKIIKRPIKSFKEEITMNDRIELDQYIFSNLGINKSEVSLLYNAISKLQTERLTKSRSMKNGY